jgi:hypothetical protein
MQEMSSSRPIRLATCRPVPPRERWGWRSLLFAAGERIAFERSDDGHDWIEANGQRIMLPSSAEEFDPALIVRRLCRIAGRTRRLALPRGEGLTCTATPTGHSLNVDPFRACVADIILHSEGPITSRAAEGGLRALDVPRWRRSPEALLSDCLLDTAGLICDLLALPAPNVLGPVISDAHYGVAVSFDLDSIAPAQVDLFLGLLDQFQVQPTVFALAHTPEEATIHDPVIDLSDPGLRRLLKAPIEIGLQSSFRASLDPLLLDRQKRRLEDAVGVRVRGHRGRNLRAFYPQSWGHLIRSGFTYDASLGYVDLPGYRNGAGVPVFVSDPGGDSRHLWSVSVGLMDRHCAALQDKKNRRSIEADLDALFGHLRQSRGLLVLDWRLKSQSSEDLPPSFEVLKQVIARAKTDRAWLGGIGEVVDGISAVPLARAVLSEHCVVVHDKPLSSDTATDYEHYHLAAGTTITKVETYVDATIASFLSLLPADAETIIDVGCGHGWVSNQIPAFHQVLCTDISEETIRYVERRKTLCSIADLPLLSRSVDLALATDVVEHLSDHELAKADAELDRVVRKYVYLQCPHDEDLPISQVICKECGSPWHITAHVRSVDAAFLAHRVGPQWRPSVVVFTGDVSYVHGPSSQDLGLGTTVPVYSYTAGPVVCPKCHAANRYSAEETIAELVRVWSPTKFTGMMLPHYSEVGVLLERDRPLRGDTEPCVLTRSGFLGGLPQPTAFLPNVIRFDHRISSVVEVDSHLQLPQINPRNCTLVPGDGGVRVMGGRLKKDKGLAVYPIAGSCPTAVSIKGTIHRVPRADARVQLSCIDPDMLKNIEVLHTYTDLSTGEFEWCGDLPQRPVRGIVVTTPVDLDFSLHAISFDDPGPVYWHYDFGENFRYGHVMMRHAGVEIRWLIPDTGYLITSGPIDKLMRDCIANIEHRPAAPAAGASPSVQSATGEGDGIAGALSADILVGSRSLSSPWDDNPAINQQHPPSKAVELALLDFAARGRDAKAALGQQHPPSKAVELALLDFAARGGNSLSGRLKVGALRALIALIKCIKRFIPFKAYIKARLRKIAIVARPYLPAALERVARRALGLLRAAR